MEKTTYQLRLYRPEGGLAFEVRGYDRRGEAFWWGEYRKSSLRAAGKKARIEVVRMRGNRPGKPIRWRLSEQPPFKWYVCDWAPKRAIGVLWEMIRG